MPDTPNLAAASKRVPNPCTIVIFGAAGDLVTRKLMPSLFHLSLNHMLPCRYNLVCVDRVEHTTDSYRVEVSKGNIRAPGLQPTASPDEADWLKFLGNITYLKADLSDPKALETLKGHLEAVEREKDIPAKRLALSIVAAECFSDGFAGAAFGGTGWPRDAFERHLGAGDH